MDRKRIIIIGIIVLIILSTISVLAVLFLKPKNNETPVAESLPAKSETKTETKSEIAKTSVAADTDNDGLADEQEALYGTDPTNPDTDGDTFKDGQEVLNGYDPLEPAPGDKIAEKIVCPANAAATPEETIRLATEAGRKGDGNTLSCYFIPEARQYFRELLQDGEAARAFGEMLSRAIKKESRESAATFTSTYADDDNVENGNFIYLVQGSDGKWLMKGL